MAHHLLFADKSNRDRAYRELRSSGKARYFTIRRGHTGPQEIHPQYVEDRKAGLSTADKGFGNMIYKTSFSNLYTLDWEE